MSFKIAYDAGHYKHTLGNRLPKELDKNKTSEWELNDRIAKHFADAASQYDGVELLRTDDVTGKKDVSLSNRCKKANNWGADFFISIHHNAGANLTNAGGIVAFSYPTSAKGAEYRDAIYDACIDAGGLKGNRSIPKTTANFYVIRYTNAPAVLMEYGFMDSKTDAPVILQDEYSKKMAYATMEAIAKVVGLKKKATKPKEKKTCNVVLPVLTKGDSGEAVKAMQNLLIAHGYPCNADGKFGDKTEKALHEFKKSKKLKVTSNCGVQTWYTLINT